MTFVFFLAAIAMLAIAIPYLVRVFQGPTLFDRLVGLNGIGTKVAVLTVLVGFVYGRVDMFVDIALGLFLLNVASTLVIARHVRADRGGA